MKPYYVKKSDLPQIIKRNQHFKAIGSVASSSLVLFFFSVFTRVTELYQDFGAELPTYYRYLSLLLPFLVIINIGVAIKIYQTKPLEDQKIKTKLAKYKQNEMIDLNQVFDFKNDYVKNDFILAFIIFIVYGIIAVASVLPIYQLSA